MASAARSPCCGLWWMRPPRTVFGISFSTLTSRMNRRMTPLVRELRVTYTPPTSGPLLHLGGPAHAAEILRRRLAPEPVEVVLVLLMNTKNRLLGVHEVGRGTLDCCIVHPRDVFKVALLANASGIILGHNHPSGEPEPSAD